MKTTPLSHKSRRSVFVAMYLLTALLLIDDLARAQNLLSLKDALRLSAENYGSVQAKSKYAAAAQQAVNKARLDYLPNVNLASEISYGTANGQNGPQYAFGLSGIASGGLPLASQSWNATFGSLFLTNINWDIFAFGRSHQNIRSAQAVAGRDARDLQQETFQLQIKVAAAYLDLLAAQRLATSYQKNLDRADTLKKIIVVKATHDLVAGVDSSQADAEVSNAKVVLLRSRDAVNEQNKKLVDFLGIAPKDISTDTLFIAKLPGVISEGVDSVSTDHPVLSFYNARVQVSEQQTRYLKTLSYPTFSLGAAFLTRGSGFGNAYTAQQPNYSTSFSDGVNFDRSNYVVAVGVTWNLTTPFRNKQQIRSQKLISDGLKYEQAQVHKELASQLELADAKLKTAIARYYESPIQVKAASDAYHQKMVLYKHGLTSLVDIQQALYALTRAETDRDIAFSNVWQAVLLKAAAAGDFSIFYKNL